MAAGAVIEDQELGQALVVWQGAGDDEGAVIEVELEGHESEVAGGGDYHQRGADARAGAGFGWRRGAG